MQSSPKYAAAVALARQRSAALWQGVSAAEALVTDLAPALLGGLPGGTGSEIPGKAFGLPGGSTNVIAALRANPSINSVERARG